MRVGTVLFTEEDVEINRKLGYPVPRASGVLAHIATIFIDSIKVYSLAVPDRDLTKVVVFCRDTSFTFDGEKTMRLADKLIAETKVARLRHELYQAEESLKCLQHI